MGVFPFILQWGTLCTLWPFHFSCRWDAERSKGSFISIYVGCREIRGVFPFHFPPLPWVAERCRGYFLSIYVRARAMFPILLQLLGEIDGEKKLGVRKSEGRFSTGEDDQINIPPPIWSC